MVLVVIGLLIALGASLIGPLTKRAKLIETREAVKAVYESILGYAASNKKLPNDLSVLGIKTIDAYTRPLQYKPAPGFETNNLCTSKPTTYLTVNDNSSGTPQTKNNVAFIVFAEGDNRTNDTGDVAGTSFTIKEQGVDDYDDIVIYADIDKLRSQICTSFKITTESLPIGTEEMAYPESNLDATDGTTPYVWSIISGSLPSGLTLQNKTSGTCGSTTCTSSNPCGCISGTPTIDGSYNFIVQVTDNDSPNRIATKSLTITINPNKPRITTEFLAYGTVSQSYPSTTLSATGGKPSYTWAVTSGSLPTGLSLNGTTGVISGTPTAAGTYSFTVTVTDSGSPARTASKTLSIAINPSGGGGCTPLSLTPPSGTSWSATVGTLFSQSIAVSGGQTPYTNTQCTPSSCNGVSMSCSSSGATISGTPTVSGTCTFNVAWNDSCTNPGPQTISGTYTVNISGAVSPTCTLLASPGIIRYGETTQLTWTITNGPANGTFSPTSGTCTSFSGSTGGSCTTGALTTAGANTFTLTLSHGGSTCQVTVYVGCQDYRVWNDYGSRRDFSIDGTCKRVNNNSEITNPQYLNTGEIIQRYGTQNQSCGGAVQATLSYDQAMNADVVINGGDGDCQVNFSGTDR
jgi:type II secretory pathway pseudopilin PulG